MEQTATDAASGVTLTTGVEHSEIVIADRLWVTDSWSIPEGYSVSFLPRDWSGTQWSVVQQIDEPMALINGVYRVLHRVQVEPFLPGQYTIPPARVQISMESTGSPTLLETEPITIDVRGVLPDDDNAGLNPIAEAGVPAESRPGFPAWLWIAGCAGLAVLAGLVVVVLTRRDQPHPESSVYSELKSIAESDNTDRQNAFDRLAQAFDRLDPRLRSTSEFSEMISACDRVRYGQGQDARDRISPTRIARHALQLLGHDTHSNRAGGDA